MNYTETLKSLEKASLFDLYRLDVSIRQRLNDPEEIRKIRYLLQEGERITYFNERNNALEPAIIIEKNKQYVVVRNERDQKMWQLNYYLINLENRDVTIHTTGKLSKTHVKVGDCVGFQSEQGEICGVIIRLNKKTVTILTKENHRWRASYSLLFKVIDAELSAMFSLIGGEHTHEKNV